MPGAGGPKVGSKTSGIGSKTSLNRSQKCKKRLQDSTVKGSWVLSCNQLQCENNRGGPDSEEPGNHVNRLTRARATKVQKTHARPN